MFLRDKGYEVTPIANAEDGIELIQRQSFDLVLLDEMLNGMDGLSALGHMKDINSSLPVIMVTKSEEESLMEEAGYPFINAHKSVHKLFVKRVADYQQRFKMDEDITEELLHTLRAWLINHIRNDDQDYSGDVRANMANVSPQKTGGWLKRFFG